MKKTLRNIFVSFLIFSSFITSPSVALAGLLGPADAIPPVPSADAGQRQKNLGITLFGITIPGINLDSLMIAFARSQVDHITNATVNYINKGPGNSGPQFLVDPIGDLGAIANGTAQPFLQSVGLGALCSPWRGKIQLALTQYYAQNAGRRPGDDYTGQCTFTGTIANLQNFIDGDFSKGGWQGWFELTQTPTGNPYAIFLDAKATLDSDQAIQEETTLLEANWGAGFLSFQKCKPSKNSTKGGASKNVCVTKTPGSVINEQLQKVLGSEVDQLNLTNDFNQIMTALLGQLQKRIFNAGTSAAGLINRTQGGYGGGGGGGSATVACYPTNSTQTVLVNTPVTWASSVAGASNPIYTWGGTASGNQANSTVTYSTPGTKNATLTVSSSPSNGGPATSQTVTCAPSITVSQFGPITGSCSASPMAAPEYVPSPSNPPTAINDVTFDAQISGGSGIYKLFVWDSSDPKDATITLYNGNFPTTVKIFPVNSTFTSLTRIYERTGTKNTSVTVIDANGTVAPVQIQCAQVVIY